MKKAILIFLTLATSSSCTLIDKIKPKTDNRDLITANTWKILALKDANGNLMNTQTLSAEALSLYNLDFDFKANKIVKASDRVSKQILNQGTWSVTEDGTSMNIDLLEFNGSFDVKKISSKVFTIQYLSDKKFAGLGKGLQLQMVPSSL